VSPLPITLQCGGDGTRTSRISEPVYHPAAGEDALASAGSPATHAETATNRHGGLHASFTINRTSCLTIRRALETAHPLCDPIVMAASRVNSPAQIV